MIRNPNFPANLDIKPSEGTSDQHLFGAAAQQDAIRKFGIAGRVWEAAYLFTTYIDCPRDVLFDPPFLDEGDLARPLNILELGSGTGIVAACCANRLLGRDATLVATDLPEVCPLLEQNLQQYIAPASNPSEPKVLVRPLTWGSDLEATEIAVQLGCASSGQRTVSTSARYLTHVICSDLVYFSELLAPLLRTLVRITAPPFVPPAALGHSPRVLISYKVRSLAKETPFWSAFGLWFSFQPVLAKRRLTFPESVNLSNVPGNADNVAHVDQTLEETWTRFGSADENDLFIFAATRRPESLTWEVPDSDEQLLAGVGARGSRTHKGDDTFEGLLLMGLNMDV